MWEALDFRDQAMVRFAQRDLRRELAMQRLARQVRRPRRSLLGGLTARLGARRPALNEGLRKASAALF